VSVLGPLFRYELTRLARRGLQPRLRAAFAGLLLGALLLLYLQTFRGVSPLRVVVSLDRVRHPDAAAAFSEKFLVAFLVVQVAVVVVVTPAVAAGAVAEEKERRSLDFLLSSPLTDWEIVAGKLAARLVFVGCVVLVGLPVLCLTLLFGGVDPPKLLAGYGITLVTVFTLGTFALFLAVRYDGLKGALVRAYLVTAGLGLFGFCCSCFYVPAYLSPFSTLFVLFSGVPRFFGSNNAVEPGEVIGWYAAGHVPFGFVFLCLAVRGIRAQTVIRRRSARVSVPVFPLGADDPPWLRALREHRPGGWRVPPLNDDVDPLAWKERYFGGRLWPAPDSTSRAILNVCLIVGGPVFFYILLALTMASAASGKVGRVYGPMARLAFAALVPALVLGAGVLAAVGVARERERQTLDDLLMIPGDRRDLLWAKALASARAVRYLVYALVGFFVAGILTGGVSCVGLLAGPAFVCGWLVWAVGFGVWLSCRCRTSGRATGYFLAAVLALLVAPPLFGPLAQASVRDQDTGQFAEGLFDGFSPSVGAWNALPEWGERYSRLPAWCGGAGAFLGGVTAGAAGCLLWAAAVRRFRDEGK
jgi:ABC-type transport system involved in multi-copper enzyme maturation permease subunit